MNHLATKGSTLTYYVSIYKVISDFLFSCNCFPPQTQSVAYCQKTKYAHMWRGRVKPEKLL